MAARGSEEWYEAGDAVYHDRKENPMPTCYVCGTEITEQQDLDYGTCGPCAVKELVEVCTDLHPHCGESGQAKLDRIAKAAKADQLSRGQVAELWHDLITGVFPVIG